MEKYDIRLAKRVVDLLGYKLVDSDKDNYWIILDDNDNDVGFIEFDKIFQNSRIKISSPSILLVDVIPKEEKCFSFRFNIADKGTVDIKLYRPDVEVSLFYPAYINIETVKGEKLGLACHDYTELWETDPRSFREYGLYLSYKYPMGEYDVSEDVAYIDLDYSNLHLHKMYRYELEYGSSDYAGRIENLRAISKADDPDFLMVSKKSFRYKYGNDELLSSKEQTIIDKRVKEYAKEHGRGREIFNYIRFMLNQMLPLKEDIFSEIFTEEVINEYGLEDFMKDQETVLKK